MAIDNFANSQQCVSSNVPHLPPPAEHQSYVNICEEQKQTKQVKHTRKLNITKLTMQEGGSESLDELARQSTSSQSEVRMRKICRVGTALWDYQAREQDELSLRPGSLVKIISEECGEEGWMVAQVDNKKGMVPKNYVILVGSQPSIILSEEVKQTTTLLGSGGFADVFLGYYRGQSVALKASRTNSDSDKETLIRESLILSRMNHKNIVGFFGLSLNPLFIVLELCQGRTLFTLGRQMISSDVLTVIGWSRQVAEALQYLHSQDVSLVYADLKAENVLIKEIPCLCGLDDDSWQMISNYNRANNTCRKCNGTRIDMLTLKLADFNVTRSIDVKRDSCAGSLLWMPPEVIKHQDKNFSKSSDVWSFGMFLWEIFSRKVPFKNCEINTIFNAILYKKETLPLPTDLPPELRIIFEECWRKLPEERPSISEILMHLQIAEEKIDSKFKWELKEEQFFEQSSILNNEEDMLVNIGNNSHKVTTPLYEVVMCMERLGGNNKLKGMMKKLGFSLNTPIPAKRLKKSKLDKGSIGLPIDFRHNVSAQLQNAVGVKTTSNDKLIVIRYLGYDNEEESFSTKPQHHRSHDSLLNQSKDDNSPSIYSTLPRFRQKAKSQCQDMTDNIKCNFNEENKKGAKRLGRQRHDYLKLSPFPYISHKQRIIQKRIRPAMKNSFVKANLNVDEEKKERQIVEYLDSVNFEFDEGNIAVKADRKLNRTNAFRPKINEMIQRCDPNLSASTNSLDDFVVIGGVCEDVHYPHKVADKPMELPNLFNCKLSPPQQPSQHLSAPSSSRVLIENECNQNSTGKVKRGRKPSNEQIPNSTFYLNGSDEFFDSTPISTDRRSSGRIAWVKTLFGTSPRQSTSIEEFGIGEQSTFIGGTVVTPAECFHPHHKKEKDEHQFIHLCALSPATELLPQIRLTPAPQLQKTPIARVYKKRLSSPEKQRMPITNHRKLTITPTDGQELKSRFSMKTIIQMQQLNNNRVSDERFFTSSQMNNLARSYTDLHTQAIVSSHKQQQPNGTLLTPDRIETTFHQRSRSSENPITSLKHSPNKLVQRLLRPVPSDGPILNPSYIPMHDNQNKSIYPLPQSSKAKTKITPIPLPRTIVSTKITDDNNDQSSWPTSQAPILNRIGGSIPRPNTLHLVPSGQIHRPNNQTPSNITTATNFFITNSSVSVRTGPNTMTHCDSGIDPEAGTEENSPEFKTFKNNITEFHGPCIKTSSPLQIQTNPPSLVPPPLPPKRTDKFRIIVEETRVPPIPKNFSTRKVNRF